MAGWPSHLDLPAREDDGTSWNKRVKAHGLSVELLDHMWFAAEVFRNHEWRQKCLRWIGPYFPGPTPRERTVQGVELNNMQSNVKVAVLGPDYIQFCLQSDPAAAAGKSIRKSWASPSMREQGWSVSVYDYIDRSWTICGTFPCGDELEYSHESTGRILVYAPTKEVLTSPKNMVGLEMMRNLEILEILEMETMEMERMGKPLKRIRRSWISRLPTKRARALHSKQGWKL